MFNTLLIALCCNYNNLKYCKLVQLDVFVGLFLFNKPFYHLKMFSLEHGPNYYLELLKSYKTVTNYYSHYIHYKKL